MLLATVTQVSGKFERSAREAVAFERRRAGITQIPESLRHYLRFQAVKFADEGADEILAPFGHQHPEGGKIARQFRDDDFRNRDFARDRGGMERPRSAKGNQSGVTRIDAAIDRHRPYRKRHRAIRDRRYAQRHRDRVKADPGAEFSQRRLGASAIKLHVAAEKAIAVEAPERKVGVGYGRLSAAAPIAYRPRIRPCRDRSHMQAATVVDPGDRTAAGADLDDVDHGKLHRLPRENIADHIAFFDRQDTIVDERGLSGGAAHVETDRLLHAENPRQVGGADHARHGPGFHHGDGLTSRLADRHGAAIRAHDSDLAGKFLRTGEVLEALEVPADARSHKG